MECSRSQKYFQIIASLALIISWAPHLAAAGGYEKKDTWPLTMQASRAAFKAMDVGAEEKTKLAKEAVTSLMKDFPVRTDWMLQDYGLDCHKWFLADDNLADQIRMIERVLDESEFKAHRSVLNTLKKKNASSDDDRWLRLYDLSCRLRRRIRLAKILHGKQKIVFTKHFNMGGSHYAYTEAQSDAQHERNFRAGTSLCILEMDSLYGTVKTLIDDPKGVIRDPDVSFDGKRILFSWKKSDRADDYHLYEMDVASGKIKQLTEGLGFADYEGCYLGNGDIVFNSSRCVQIVDCWWTEVSNLYRCDKDGRFLRRLSFDQVHSNFPTVLDDGRVIYTRWDYNDRGQLYPQPLFQMNPDGTSQMEYYGNNSWFPTTILHARGIPGSGKIVAIASGHHSRQTGKLIIIDASKGRQENSGVQLVAPVRETKAERIDAYGQRGELFQYPYPLSETEYLVTYSPYGWSRKPTLFGIYHMTIDGKRELLAADGKISCNQSVPLSPRPRPHPRPNTADYKIPTGTYYVQDIYKGQSLKGIPRGTIKKLRVIEIQFRAAGVKSNGNGGPAGGALVSTPIAIRNGSWDVKVVLGDAKVYADGSVCFNVPARRPVYFQALDENGRAVQSMRSWSTLQPGETFSCVGCHESKDETPATTSKPTIAMAMGPQKLEPFYGPPRGFSFPREIQPILDRHCIRCHNDRTKKRGAQGAGRRRQAVDLKNTQPVFPSLSKWQFTFEEPAKGWQGVGFDAGSWKTAQGGFGTAGTPGANVKTQWNTTDIWLRRTFQVKEELAKQPLALNVHHDEDVQIYINGVRVLRAKGYLHNYETAMLPATATKALKPGQNVIAVHCRQTGGGQYIDLGLLALNAAPVQTEPEPKPAPAKVTAFSMLDAPNRDGGAGRIWSDAYLALTNGGKPDEGPVRWLNVQSIPPLLPPNFAGSVKSPLMDMLDEGHNGVKLSAEETEKIACWIDLLVPYCGDYLEANCWNEKELAKYLHFQKKRDDMAVVEADNIRKMIAPAIAADGLLPSAAEVENAYRNLAVNPAAAQGYARSWPHASANSEYHDMPAFAARNAIDGKTENTGHGGKFPSWGPDKQKGLWWKVDFGRLVETDKIVLHIRADFPHDDYWHSATIEFSDGTKQSIEITKTAGPQEIKFDKRIISWLRLTDLVEAEPLGWCGLTEVQVWGKDIYAPGETLAAN